MAAELTYGITDAERYELMQGDGCSEPDYGKEENEGEVYPPCTWKDYFENHTENEH